MNNLPRFSRKDTRQLAAELDAAGFQYVGDDTKGHAEFVHPAHPGKSISLAETPGRGQIARIRSEMRRITGNGHGSYDSVRAKSKGSAERQRARAIAEKRDRETEAWLNKPFPADNPNLLAAAVNVVRRAKESGVPAPTGTVLIRAAQQELQRAQSNANQPSTRRYHGDYLERRRTG